MELAVVLLVEFPVVVAFPTLNLTVLKLLEAVLESCIQITAFLVFAAVLSLGEEAVRRELACLLG